MPISNKTWRKYILSNSQYWLNLITTFASQSVTAVSLLLLTPFMLMNLGDADFSLYGLLVLNLLPFSLIFDFGFNAGLLRRLIQEKEKSSTLVSNCFFFFLAIWPVIFALFSFLFKTSMIAKMDKPYYFALLLSVLVVLNLVALLFDIIIQSENKIFLGKIIRIIKTVTETILTYIACKYYALNGVLLVLVLSSFLYVVLLYFTAQKVNAFKIIVSDMKRAEIIMHFNYSAPYFLSALASVLVYNAQTLFMGKMVTAVALARFLVITRFYEVVRAGMGNFTQILFPSIARMELDNNWHKLRKHFFSVTLRMLLLCLIFAFLLLSIGKIIFLQWSGFTDDEIVRMYYCYTALILLLVIEHVPTVFFAALKLNKIPTIVSLIQGLLGLVLSAWLVPKYGVIGVIYASIMALLGTSFWFSYVYLHMMFRKKISLNAR
jgi:O-antigen/teichoic acid export membrane protein